MYMSTHTHTTAQTYTNHKTHAYVLKSACSALEINKLQLLLKWLVSVEMYSIFFFFFFFFFILVHTVMLPVIFYCYYFISSEFYKLDYHHELGFKRLDIRVRNCDASRDGLAS